MAIQSRRDTKLGVRRKKSVFIILSAVLTLVVLAVWWICLGRSIGYPVRVSLFTSQADRIKKGMTEDEALRVVVQRTGITYSADRRTLYFSLEAKPDAIIPRTTVYIRVDLSESGRVQEVSVSDGPPIKGRFW